MQDEFKVYGRDGEPCDRCGTPIAKIRVAGRGTWFCPDCQVLPVAEASRGPAAGRPLEDRPDEGYLPRPLPFPGLSPFDFSASVFTLVGCSVVLHLGGVLVLGLGDVLGACLGLCFLCFRLHRRARAELVVVAQVRPHGVLADLDRLALVADRDFLAVLGLGRG